jgi:predicted nucleic acid-binding protein
MIVLDASVLIEVLLRTPDAELLGERLFETGPTLHGPHLIDAEVAQVVRRLVRTREIDDAYGQMAVADLVVFPLRRHPHTALMVRVWELRNSLTAYDAIYVALAEALDAPLLTRDARLAKTGGHRARIELV